MAVVIHGNTDNVAKVDDCGILMVGLDGFTLEDLVCRYSEINLGIHVKDGDEWVPVKIGDLKFKDS
jgi:hypothetical protein